MESFSWSIIYQIDKVGQNCQYPPTEPVSSRAIPAHIYISSVCKRILAVPKDYIDISNIHLGVGKVRELIYLIIGYCISLCCGHRPQQILCSL